MNIVLIDDEIPAINYLARILKVYKHINIVGKFDNSFQAMMNMERLKPDIVFLEAELSGINGIQLAEKIQDILPDIKFVFVTANEQRAVEAFEVNAIDYLIKPVQIPRLFETVRRFNFY